MTTRQEPIIYYCDVRKSKFKRNALIDDELEIRRALCGVEFMTRTAPDGTKYLLVKSVRGFQTGPATGYSSSIPALLFGSEHARVRKKVENLWDFTRAAYGIEKGLQRSEVGVQSSIET